MNISKISNLNFSAMVNPKNKIKRQKVRIFNPEQKPQDPDKILLLMSKTPVFVCTNADSIHSIALDPNRGFVQTIYTPLDNE